MLCTTTSDFYALLRIPRDASPKDIKAAYHRTLLRLHPDKLLAKLRHHTDIASPEPKASEQHEPPIDVALLKEAYTTLSDAGLRAAYDGSSRRTEHARPRGPRPAQIVSLEEFCADKASESAMGNGARMCADTDAPLEWRYACRCGGAYRITEDDLENGTHLVGCESCSEVIWVGYEEAATGDESESN